MVNIDQVPQYILEDTARNLGWQEDDFRADYDPLQDPLEPYLERIKVMNIREVFDCYCNWHGLIDRGEKLFNVVVALQKSTEALGDAHASDPAILALEKALGNDAPTVPVCGGSVG